YLYDLGRISLSSATDSEAIGAMKTLAEVEGIIPALESAHAVAEVLRLAPKRRKSEIIVVGLSGRGDKDIDTVAEHFGERI
ncbi:MAG: tryptophan synthase subunit beta, partial [Candidatus Binatia bacterium]